MNIEADLNPQDYAPSPLALLPAVVSALTQHGYMNNPRRPKFQVFVDGGVRRATDVLKAVALGATAVGIGRPMIYAMSTYGEEGVSRLLQILKVRTSLCTRCGAYEDRTSSI